ncbi:hypothetical protein CC86DRAFT_347717 [Ophiobolus disseminans]|uniref:Pentacotripeptide-repeat region of PRORP domain-containing protein n=1 Tax=Ophiobolus disseminans TaxID=1469910 RepID=A0A6A7A3J3_9PLEO|nr:hypothetical protein CC86DRAFT_347717 [Ophiobolus disseminans]
MLGPYVCRQCRVRLSRRIAPTRSPQWQPRATFQSLRNKAQDDADPPHPEAQPQQPRHIQEESPDSQPTRNNAIRIRTQGRYSRSVEADAERRRRPSFAPQADSEQAGAPGAAKISHRAAPGPASAIDEALANNDVEQAWALFGKTYTSRDCAALMKPRLGDIALLNNGTVFRNLLKAVTSAFCTTKDTASITPTMVLLRYEQLGLTRPECWARDTLDYLTHQAILGNNDSPKMSGGDLSAILAELLSVWRLFFQCNGTAKLSLDSVSTHWNLPTLETLPNMFEDRGFSRRLQKFHPGYVGEAVLGFCAVYSYVLFRAPSVVQSLQQDAQPLIRFLERLLASSRVDFVFHHTLNSVWFENLPKDVQSEVMNNIEAAPQNAMAAMAARGDTLGKEATDDEAANLEAFHFKQIAHAVESRNSSQALEMTWNQTVKAYATNGTPTIPHRIYNAFLSGYLVLGQAQRSVEVWNHMIAHGIRPNIQSWVALLDGCVKARDLTSFNAMWTRMLNTGVEPDNYAWTTRITGLFNLRQVNLGLAALDDMGKRWVSADNVIQNSQTRSRSRKGAKALPASAKAVNKCTKPSIEVINGAISALVKMPAAVMRQEKRIEYIHKILTWAAGFFIKPDAVTYNSLIQLYILAGDYSTAFKILGQMEKDGIEGDIATHSILITALFDNHSLDGLTGTQQADKIIALFDSIEAGGIKLNEYAYGTAIDRLLKQYSNNTAVRRILDHMHERNVQLSAQIYTMLIQYYFQQNPPAIPAVDSLVDQLFKSRRTPTDRLLFDRTIEGYAHHGEIGKMMSVITRMSKLGTTPSFLALSAVLDALIQDGDYDRARNIVRDVENSMGVAKGGVTGGREAQYRFFAMVRIHGLDRDIMQAQPDHYDEQSASADFQTLEQDQDRAATQHQNDDAQWVDPESMGNFTFSHRASQDGMMPGDQSTQQEADSVHSQYDQLQGDAQYEREPRPEPTPDEEDVHGFLRDEHDDCHSKVDRPEDRR